MLFEFAAALAVSRFVKSIVIDDEVFERLFNRNELHRIIKLSARKLSGNPEFGEAAAEVIKSLGSEKSSSVAVRGFTATYELLDHNTNPDYYWIDGTIRYERNFCPPEIIIDAYIPKDKARQTVHSDGSEFSWIVVTGSAQRDMEEDDFSLKSVSVEANDCKITKVSRGSKSGIKYQARLPQPLDFDIAKPVVIEIEFRAKQARKFGFVATTFKFLTKGYSIEVDYSGLGFVNEVWQLGHIVGDQSPAFDHRHNSALERVESHLGGWALPGSGVTVTWMEQEKEDPTDVTP